MSTPRVMSTDPLLKYIQQRLVTFLRFIQHAVLWPTIARKPCMALFKRLAIFLRFLRSRWDFLSEKQWRMARASSGLTKPEKKDGSIIDTDSQSQASVSQSTIDEQILIPLNHVACSLYPSGSALDDASGSTSSDTPIFLQSPELLPRDRNISTPHIYVSANDSCSAIYSTKDHLVSSPIVDTRRHAHHRLRGYSTESVERLGSREMSSSRHITDVDPDRVTLDLSIDPTRRLSRQETSVSTPICFEDGPDGIYPVAPEKFNRHEKRRRIPKAKTVVTMGPLLRDFSDYDNIPGWSTCTSSGGARYFHHTEKRIFTDADLHDSTCLHEIMEAISIIETFIAEHNIQMPEKTDLVLGFLEDSEKFTAYYFADHASRIVVYLHEFPSLCIPHWGEIEGINSGTHLRHALEMQYWWHCHTYPNCIELSNSLVCELRASVLNFIAGCRTSPYVNSPYTLTDLENILSCTDSLKENVGQPYSGNINFLGRLMFEMSSTKFFNFYGQPEARLNRDQSVYGVRTNRRTWFIKSISIFLFSAPDVHLRILQKMRVDGIVHKVVWEELLKKVIDEWREFILYATVLLNANVAFLAITSVDSNRNPYRSPAQISSYCSISASIGSIILGLILVRQNQTKHRETASDVQDFLQNRAHPWLGLETLAIMFSLPYALLMWGMVSFLMAFWFMCLQESSAPTRSVVAIVCGVILILIVWCIWTSWEKQPPSDAESPEDDLLSFERDTAKLRKGFKFERVIEPTPQNSRWWLSAFPLTEWMSWDKQPSDAKNSEDNNSSEGERETTRHRARRSRTSSWATTFKSSFKNSRRETETTAVEESVDDEKGKSSP